MVPANPDDAHRPLEKQHDLAAILSHVEKRRVNADYTFPLDAKTYRILRQDICTDSGAPTSAWSNGGMVRWRLALTDGISGGEMRSGSPR